jgi:hypothetical protein
MSLYKAEQTLYPNLACVRSAGLQFLLSAFLAPQESNKLFVFDAILYSTISHSSFSSSSSSISSFPHPVTLAVPNDYHSHVLPLLLLSDIRQLLSNLPHISSYSHLHYPVHIFFLPCFIRIIFPSVLFAFFSLTSPPVLFF